jgi:hypothetical protein
MYSVYSSINRSEAICLKVFGSIGFDIVPTNRLDWFVEFDLARNTTLRVFISETGGVWAKMVPSVTLSDAIARWYGGEKGRSSEVIETVAPFPSKTSIREPHPAGRWGVVTPISQVWLYGKVVMV